MLFVEPILYSFIGINAISFIYITSVVSSNYSVKKILQLFILIYIAFGFCY